MPERLRGDPDFAPGEVVTGVALAAGAYDVKIVAAADDCSKAAILEANDVELASGKGYTAVAYLTEAGVPKGIYAMGFDAPGTSSR